MSHPLRSLSVFVLTPVLAANSHRPHPPKILKITALKNCHEAKVVPVKPECEPMLLCGTGFNVAEYFYLA